MSDARLEVLTTVFKIQVISDIVPRHLVNRDVP